jgi:hypothetical protein
MGSMRDAIVAVVDPENRECAGECAVESRSRRSRHQRSEALSTKRADSNPKQAGEVKEQWHRIDINLKESVIRPVHMPGIKSRNNR